jgi:hypothetical protein
MLTLDNYLINYLYPFKAIYFIPDDEYEILKKKLIKQKVEPSPQTCIAYGMTKDPFRSKYWTVNENIEYKE